MPTAPAGFSADTFSRAGLISGATATEAACRALPDGLWVSAGERQECIRYGSGGTQGPPRTALIYIPGDPGGASYSLAGGVPTIERASEYYELSQETRDFGADALSGAMGGIPVILMARPGMHGSSGNHAQDRHTEAEVALLDAAVSQLRQRYGFPDLALFGFSSGGTIVANLLARRSDIRCAVIGSAPLDLEQFYERQDGRTSDYYTMHRDDLADPMRTVGSIRSGATIFVIGDQRDRNVPADAWGPGWRPPAAPACMSTVRKSPGWNAPNSAAPSRATTTPRAAAWRWPMAAPPACRPDACYARLRSGSPILPPRGRRLSGPEIRAAFSGRSLRATEWFPRVNVLSHWGKVAA